MSYIFGGNTGKTAAQVKREREIAEALMGRTLSRTPRNVGEGLSAIGNALAYRAIKGRADKADKEGRAGADAAFAPIMAALGGRQGQQASPAGIESSPLSAPGNLPPEVIDAVMMTESGGDPNAVSPKGAEGLMQVMPATGADPGYGVTPLDPNKPGDNLRFGTDYLNAMHREQGGDLDKALAAYNAGPGAVAKYGGVPPYPETRAYIEKVKGRLPTQTPMESPSAPQSAPQSLLPLLMKAAGNDYLNPGQQAVVSALLQRELGGKDMPAAVQQYQFAQQQGYGGSFMDYLAATKGGTTVNVGPQGVDYGKPPTDTAWARDENNKVRLDERGVPIALPIGGTKLQTETAAAAEAKAAKEAQKSTQADIVLEDIDRALGAAGGWTTGIGGAVLSGIPGTGAHDLTNILNTIKANVGFDKLQAMRDASPTGGALGQVSEKENVLLQSTLGALEQSQSREQFEYNLKRLKNVYLDIVHGPGKGPSRTPLDGVKRGDRRKEVDGYTIEEVD